MSLWPKSPEQSALAADNAQLKAHLEALRSDFVRVADGYDRLLEALRASGAAVFVYDEQGREAFNSIASVVGLHEGDSVAIRRLISNATQRTVAEGALVEQHNLIGPPPRSVQIRASQLIGRDGKIGTVAVLDDITEAGRLDRLRRELVVNVGHELRTPVGALGVLAETLAAEVEHPDANPEVVRRLARRMESETVRLGEFVNDVLELASAHDVLPGAVRMADVLDQAVGRVATAAEVAGIEVLADPVDPAVIISGERSKLVSAVFNLLDNAVKYSASGSVVRVTVRNNEDDIWIDVIDRGLGIAPRDRERVFDRYFRVDRARTRTTGGSGLGLAIVHEIVAAHHGEVLLRSVEGHGSTFTIRIPVAPHPDVADTLADYLPGPEPSRK